MSYILTPRQNLLLAALPEKDLERLQYSLELVSLSKEWTVYENGCELGLVYFPVTSVISLLTISDEGDPVIAATVGNEGVFGISMLMGRKISPARAVVHTAGYSYRLRADHLRREFELGGWLRYLLQRYTRTLTAKITQAATNAVPLPALRPEAVSRVNSGVASL
jgi:hypothetical protein